MDGMQYINVTPGNGIYFPAVSYLRAKILKACEHADFAIPVVIDCQKITGIDYTAAQGISKISSDLCRDGDNATSCLLILYRLDINYQKLIGLTENIVFCEDTDKLCEFLTQESLRNGFISLKDHIRSSIDLGYKIEMVA